MDNKVYVSVNSSTANPPSHVSRMEQLDKILANSVIAGKRRTTAGYGWRFIELEEEKGDIYK